MLYYYCYSSAGDADAVWKSHMEDTQVLNQYAESMRALATNHWTKNASTRIDWCRDAAIDYFHGGGLERALEKDRKKREREDKRREGETGSNDSAKFPLTQTRNQSVR